MNVEKAKKALLLLDTDDKIAFFFRKLKSAEWVPILIEQDYFKDPPQPVIIEEQERHPIWPAIEYLRRISDSESLSSVDKKMLVEGINAIKTTKNLSVLSDILHVSNRIQHIPNKERLDDVIAAIISSELNHIPWGIIHQIQNLYETFSTKLPRDFLDKLFVVLFSVKVEVHEFSGKRMNDLVPMLLDNWEYQETASKTIEKYAITSADGFCLLLRISDSAFKKKFGEDFPQDLSFIWFQNLETPRNLNDPEDSLLNSIVQASKDRKPVRDTFNLLIDYPSQWFSFIRVQLMLLEKHFSELGSECIRKMNLDQLVSEVGLWNEFSFFLNKHFADLDKELQDEIISKRKSYARSLENKKLRDGEMLRFYQIIEEYLPEEEFQEYKKLLVKYDRIPIPNSHFYSSSMKWIGPVAPVTMADLKDKGISEILDFLKEWNPEQSFDGPSPEGMARLLEEDFRERVKDYINEIIYFKEIHPTYVRAFFSALEGYCASDAEWGKLLELGYWVCSQDDATVVGYKGVDEFDSDKDWSWTRKRIASFLNKALSDKNISIKHDEAIWNLLILLLSDNEPTPEYESKYGGANMDPFTLSTNTVRGTAAHALMAYVHWLNSHDMLSDREVEVVSVLNDHLVKDPSLAVRSVYGYYFPYLTIVLENWSNKNAQSIFPAQPEKRSHLFAAIHGLQFRSSYENLINYPEVFELVINWLNDNNYGRKFQTYDSLVETLWRCLLNERLCFDDNSLLKRIFEVRNTNFDRQFIAIYGKIYQSNSDLLSKIKSELIKIWEYFINVEPVYVEKVGYPPGQSVLSQFGPWFASQSVFDANLKLDLTLKTVEKSRYLRGMEEAYQELDRLADNSELIEKVGMVLYSFKPIHIDYYSSDRVKTAKSILKKLEMRPETIKIGKDIRQALIESGRYEFVKLE